VEVDKSAWSGMRAKPSPWNTVPAACLTAESVQPAMRNPAAPPPLRCSIRDVARFASGVRDAIAAAERLERWGVSPLPAAAVVVRYENVMSSTPARSSGLSARSMLRPCVKGWGWGAVGLQSRPAHKSYVRGCDG